ncbi:hypothetical protein D3C85_1609240 [compost metagenome]
MERADCRGFDQTLGHAAAGGGSELEIEVTQFALEDLCRGDRTPQQAAEQEKRGLEHASLHEQRGAGVEKPAETLDPDTCKHTGECSASRAVRRFLKY